MFFNEFWNKSSDSPAIEKNEIQTHNFENAKNALKKFSEDIPSSPKLPTVDTHQCFGLFSRDVTGSELNNLTAKIQDCLVATNNQQIRVIKEFEQIYQTFEALDKDYIQGLIAGNKAAEVASNQAKKAATKAFKAIEESKKNTNDIERLLKTQHIIIDKLVAFKERIENIPNIDNVSTMWKDLQELIDQVHKIKAEMADTEAVTKDRFAAQERQIASKNEELISLISKNRAEFSEGLIAQNKKQSQEIGELTNQIEIIQNEIKKNEATNEQRFAMQNTQLLKKIKIAYMVAGASGTIALAHVILSALGIV